MLVLSRRVEESLRIGNDIEVKVLSVSRGQVTLGITAPVSVPVHRREVFEAIQAMNRSAAHAQPSDFENGQSGKIII